MAQLRLLATTVMLAPTFRGHCRNAADLRPDGIRIRFRIAALTRRCRPSAGVGRGAPSQVGAESRDLHLHRLGRTVAERDHRNHRTDADFIMIT